MQTGRLISSAATAERLTAERLTVVPGQEPWHMQHTGDDLTPPLKEGGIKQKNSVIFRKYRNTHILGHKKRSLQNSVDKKAFRKTRDEPTIIPYTIVGTWVRYTYETQYEGLFYQMSNRRVTAPTVTPPPQTGTDE